MLLALSITACQAQLQIQEGKCPYMAGEEEIWMVQITPFTNHFPDS